ncbi:unnamed protein product [Xylocopa violacea]|uniref:Secreted protein n=1 Tax=Xylocopa violacea TaxID=135666 RepID=A0ABP1PIG6_XYLVO
MPALSVSCCWDASRVDVPCVSCVDSCSVESSTSELIFLDVRASKVPFRLARLTRAAAVPLEGSRGADSEDA